MEHKEREKQDARVGEVQQDLQELSKKFESVEHELKVKEAELVKALASIKDAKAEAEKAQQEIQEAKKIAAGAFADLAMQRIGCRGVLPCRGGERDGEAVLVPVCWGRTSNASE